MLIAADGFVPFPPVIVPGEILRGARVAARLSRQEVAREAQVHARTVGAAERDGRVSVASLKALADALGRTGIIFLRAVNETQGPGMRLGCAGAAQSAVVVRAAAAALGLGAHELAAKAGVGERTVVRLLDVAVGNRTSLDRLRAALERETVIFLEPVDHMGPGFRLPLSLIGRDDLRF